jgi:hypothetical protein
MFGSLLQRVLSRTSIQVHPQTVDIVVKCDRQIDANNITDSGGGVAAVGLGMGRALADGKAVAAKSVWFDQSPRG